MSTLGQLAAYLPYLVGFEPHRSIVAVGLIDGEIGLTARTDVVEGEAATAQLAGHVVSALVRGEHTGALLFGVADGPDPAPVLAAIGARARAAGLEVSHTARLDGRGSWRATCCSCGRCPREWTALPDIRDHPAVLDRLADSDLPAPDRADLAGRLDPRPDVGRRVARELDTARREAGMADIVAAIDRVLHGGEPVEDLPAATLAAAAVGMQDVLVRDAVLRRLLPRLFPAGGDGDVVDLLREADLDREIAALLEGDLDPDRPLARLRWRAAGWARCLPDDVRPPVLTLFAALQWVDGGGGALGLTAVERALRIDPGYRLAGLLWQIYESGMRPIPRERRRTA